MVDYKEPPWNLKTKGSKTTFGAPRFAYCFSYKGTRFCSELTWHTESLALAAGERIIKEKFDEGGD